MAIKDLGAVVPFKGYYDDLATVVAGTFHVVEDGTEEHYLPEGASVPGNTVAEGIHCYGATKGVQALFEGVVASSRYPKHWLTVGDPSCEFTMMQSAPLMVLPDPDEFVMVQAKQSVSGGEMSSCLLSQEAEMAIKGENLNRPRQLADLLGCKADISRSIADIAQRVSEWEEGLAVSPGGIMYFDESGADQDHVDDGKQLNNTDAPDDVKTVRVRKCL